MREEFEKWFANKYGPVPTGTLFLISNDKTYSNALVQSAWEAWQAGYDKGNKIGHKLGYDEGYDAGWMECEY